MDVAYISSIFQSTHPRGVRLHLHLLGGRALLFQSTHPRGVRPPCVRMPSSPPNFNPRTHVGCDEDRAMRIPGRIHFNPRTHVGCDCEVVRHEIRPIISIHAPTWGATRADTKPDRNHKISIHAPTWGATVDDAIDVAHQRISIHAPTWGATSRTTRVESPSGFQSTHPRGVRRNPKLFESEVHKFQSTHPRGVRPRTDNIKIDTAKFQSTHPRGVRRLHRSDSEEHRNISIHAPTWGATDFAISASTVSSISIHAPTWGATSWHSFH